MTPAGASSGREPFRLLAARNFCLTRFSKSTNERARGPGKFVLSALHHRDHGCRFPGCGVSFGQGHHIRHWAHGGPTTLSNLAMLCRRHHRAVHEEGYQVERQPDGELRFRRPDGRPLPDVPLPPVIPDDPVQALRARNEAAGLNLHAQTLNQPCAASACSLNPRAFTTLRIVSKSGLRSPESAL